MNSKTGFLWVPALNRWLVARERLATLGWPVTQDMASGMGAPMVESRDYLSGRERHEPSVRRSRPALGIVMFCSDGWLDII